MEETTGKFHSFDNKELYYRYFTNGDKIWNGKTLIFIHRLGEYSGRIKEIVESEQFMEYRIFMVDLRGNGLSGLDYPNSFMDFVRDLEVFKNYLNKKYSIAEDKSFYIGHSLGALIVTTWVNDYSPKILGMGLISPIFKPKMFYGFESFVKALAKILPKYHLNFASSSNLLTDDISEQQKIDVDSMIRKKISVDLFNSIIKTAKRVMKGSKLVNTPTLFILAEKDFIGENKYAGNYYSKIRDKHKKIYIIDEAYHDIFNSDNKDTAIEIIDLYINNLSYPRDDYSSMEMINKELELEKDLIYYGKILSYGKEKIIKYILAYMEKFDLVSRVRKTGFFHTEIVDYIHKSKQNNAIGKLLYKTDLFKAIIFKYLNFNITVDKTIKNLFKLKKEVNLLVLNYGMIGYYNELLKRYPELKIRIVGKDLLKDDNGIKIENSRLIHIDSDIYNLSAYNKEFIPDIICGIGVLEDADSLIKMNNLFDILYKISDKDVKLVFTNAPYRPYNNILAKLHEHQFDKITTRKSEFLIKLRLESLGFLSKEKIIDDYGYFTINQFIKR